MRKEKCAVFSCLGLGDGLLALIVSNNLQRNGNEVVTFHPWLEGLSDWFPHLPLKKFPELEELKAFDRFFIFYEKKPAMQAVLSYCLKYFPEKTHVLNPIATTNRDYLYWEEGKFDGNLCLADNLYAYCKNQLKLENVVKTNGIVIRADISPRKFKDRIVIHPTSSKPEKNWPKEKFLAVAEGLKKLGKDPVFILTAQERLDWPEVKAPHFANISDMTAFVAESGAMIGNDSGIGHLASCLGLPTVTIGRNRNTAKFWRPGWSKGALIVPAWWIPNLKMLRLRDKYWKRWITVERVLSAYLSIDEI
jgi:hypothetical protein